MPATGPKMPHNTHPLDTEADEAHDAMPRRSSWSGRCPVTAEIAGSSPARGATR